MASPILRIEIHRQTVVCRERERESDEFSNLHSRKSKRFLQFLCTIWSPHRTVSMGTQSYGQGFKDSAPPVATSRLSGLNQSRAKSATYWVLKTEIMAVCFVFAVQPLTLSI